VTRSIYFGPENGYNHAETLTPILVLIPVQYFFVLGKDFEQYFRYGANFFRKDGKSFAADFIRLKRKKICTKIFTGSQPPP